MCIAGNTTCHVDRFDSYLLALFPLILCAISIVVIALRLIKWRLQQRSPDQQKHLLVDVAEDVQSLGEDNEDDEERLTLQKTVSRSYDAIRDVDRPRGEIVWVSLELVAILAQLALSIYALAVALSREATCSAGQGSSGCHRAARGKEQAAAAGIIVWAYLISLVAIRLFLSARHSRIPSVRLWYHTAFIYGAQWLFQIWIFRSSIIDPAHQSRYIVIPTFVLTTILFLIALTARKGNRGVVVEYEDNLEPSHEPLASVLSLATFSWVDPIVWKGFHKTLEHRDVWNIALKDKADAVLADFRQVKKASALTFRLLRYFSKSLLLQGAWAALGGVFMFLPTLLLKAILEYLEDPVTVTANAAWLYVILLFITGIVQAVADGQALWIGRKICIRLRAIIVGEIYSKTLRRKAASSKTKELGKMTGPKPTSLRKRLFWFLSKDQRNKMNSAAAPDQSDAQVDNGTIINLMSIDSFRVADICAYLHFLWAATPVELAMAIGLLYRVLGPASFAGIGMMILVLPVNLFIAKAFQSAQKRIMSATDKRIHSTNEVLQNIRIIKYFAWEERFFTDVNEKRRVELRAIWRKYVLWCSAATIWSGLPILITFVSFWIYTALEKRPLLPSIAFPALSMFSLLRIPLDQLADMVAHVQESKVSIDRVEEFLDEEETEKYLQLEQSKRTGLEEPQIRLKKATLTWGSKARFGSAENTGTFSLLDIDVNFALGALNVIAGPTGSGKTSLLMALLGEMKLISGQVQIPGGFVRQNLVPDPLTGLTESVAYCAQQAWLVNDTIKQNVLFASPYDERRYKTVLSVCALEKDMEIFETGDQTLVGEKGIALSGGQKQRISLARAMYSNSKHLLLDDCLSAVDSHTAQHIFQEAIMGPLMSDRTCILVTHNIGLAAPHARYVVVMDNGKVAAEGEPEKVVASGALGNDLSKSRPASRAGSKAPSRVPSDLEQQKSHLSSRRHYSNGSANADASAIQSTDKPADQTEAKAEGSVKVSIIKMYLGSMGPWYFWVIAATAFLANQVGNVATNVWIRQWANAYHTSRTRVSQATLHGMHGMPSLQIAGLLGSSRSPAPLGFEPDSDLRSISAEDQVDTSYYLGVYALIGCTYIFVCFGREFILFWGSLRASAKLHEHLLNSILRAKFRFFDTTPLGQLMNRFSKDIQSIDQEVSPIAVGLIHSGASVITIVILISVITPGFLIPGVIIACIYAATGTFYIRSSRDLKRIEAVQRSPLFQHFGETLSGVVTIRAYGDEPRFMTDSHKRVNAHNRPYLFLWATNRWLALRVDFAGALVSFSSGIFVVLSARTIDAGAAGLALTYAITFTQNVLWLVRLYAANEQNMNAVERVQEYIDVDQEAPAHVPETKPLSDWPNRGAVDFVGYSTRYRSDLGLVLDNLSFSLPAAAKVGIVGRTGAGKSSLALALFRGLEAEEGKILIDDVDIGLIGLQDLREAITIVPQDPTLFTGTIRNNLDPFGVFTDEEIFTALRKVQLISSNPLDPNESGTSTPNASGTTANSSPTSTLNQNHLKHSGVEASLSKTIAASPSQSTTPVQPHENRNIFRNLSSPVAESGSNLSQGQRQLLCLARALLKDPKVLIMDEATASIDYATDAKIQDTLRELKGNTIVTIAHRLKTIIDYDLVLVLDKGKVMEYAPPWELIGKENGMFKGMCETSGDFEVLVQGAQRARKARLLVDVDEEA